MCGSELLRDVVTCLRTLNPEATALITIEPDSPGPIDPHPPTSSLEEDFGVVHSAPIVDAPLREQPRHGAFREGLFRIDGKDQKIDSMRCVRHPVVYPGPRA